MTAVSNDIQRAAREGPTVGHAVWNDIGTPLHGQKFTDGHEMVQALGLDWRVSLEPLINQRTGKQIGQLREVIKEDGAGRPNVGVVKQRYHALQNLDTLGPLPQLAGEQGLEIVNGGELGGGSRIWVLMKAGEHVFKDRILPNGEQDRIEQHLLMWGSHDGETSQRFAAIPHAFWCANALASAWREAGTNGSRWSITHTKSAEARLQQMLAATSEAIAWMGDFNEQLVALEQDRFTSKQMRAYAERLLIDVEGLIAPKTTEQLGLKKSGEPRADTAIVSRERRVTKLVDLFDGEGASCRGGSKLDAYQAVTEFIDHHRRRATKGRNAQARLEARFNDTVFGAGPQRTRERAMVMLRQS